MMPRKTKDEKQSKTISVRLKPKHRIIAERLARKQKADSLGAWFFEGRRKEIEAAL